MPRALEDARARIDRAEVHRKAIHRAVDSFFSRRRPPYRVDEELDEDRLYYRQRFHLTSTLPLRFSVLIGEVLYNLRSALDHTLWELGAREFPIFNEFDDFVRLDRNGHPARSSGLYRLRHCSEEVRHLVHAVQPYHRGDPTSHPLWLLHELRNIDTHRYLHVAVAASHGSYRLPPLPDRGSKATWHFHSGRLQDGEIIASCQFNTPQSQVQAEFPFALSIAFNEPALPSVEFVNETLDSVQLWVRQVVGMFARFF